jgi:hypothetical protein
MDEVEVLVFLVVEEQVEILVLVYLAVLDSGEVLVEGEVEAGIKFFKKCKKGGKMLPIGGIADASLQLVKDLCPIDDILKRVTLIGKRR